MARVTKSVIEDNAEKLSRSMLFRDAAAGDVAEADQKQKENAPAARKKTAKKKSSANSQSMTPVVSFKTKREELEAWNTFMDEHGLRKDAFYRFACNEYIKNHAD